MYYSPNTLLSSLTFRLSLSYKRRTRFSGWRGGFVLAIIGSSLVLLFNTICAIVAAAAGNPQDGIATIYTGKCAFASRLTTGLQLLINILSSAVLGASSYCLQQLGAPTRDEIDEAHGKGKWLHVGVLSLRNLPNLSKRRQVVWLSLAISSIPLHFLYNSVIFQTTATNDIDFVFAHEAFLVTRGGWKLEGGNQGYSSHFQAVQDTLLGEQYLNASHFENISATECFHRYQTTLLKVGNGFAIIPKDSSSDSNDTGSLVDFYVSPGMLTFDKSFVSEVSYCLSEISPERCQVQLSQNIIYIVIACNVLHLALMFVVLKWMNHETIVTVGDAIDTFIRIPDTTTKRCCLMTNRNMNQMWKTWEAQQVQRYQPGRHVRWYSAISGKRWLFLVASYSSAIASAIYMYSLAGSRSKNCRNADGVWEICRWNGFGNVDSGFILDPYPGVRSVMPYVLLANTPQAIASLLYYSYNGVFTAMLANREWARYAYKRAALRVSEPTSTQRSTYFLSLPFRYSLPLIISSILLHWFISQTLFMVRIAVYKDGVLVTTFRGLDLSCENCSVTSLGFSDSALIAAIVMGCLMVVVCLAIAGLCRYPTGMPLGCTNTAVISAACHVRHTGGRKVEDLDDVVERPLQWGVTIEGTKDQVGHCSFSDKAVQKPVEGCLYA